MSKSQTIVLDAIWKGIVTLPCSSGEPIKSSLWCCAYRTYSRDSIISTFSIISTVCKIPKWLYYKHSTKVNFRSRKNISTVSIISTVQKISKWLYHKYSTKAIFRLNEKITSVFYKCGESFEVETLRYFLYC